MAGPGEVLGSVVAASEREQLDTFLDYLRDAVVRKARGVSEEDARRSPVPTGTNLGGLIKHPRWVELGGFAEQVIGAYQAECDRSREIAAQYSLDYAPRGRELTLRWVYLHVILETARHAGHADILREMIDGSVGD
jgi:hypothetical protein